MNNFFKTLLAGWGAAKLGGGCVSTILIFFLIYWLLGTCDNNTRAYAPQKPHRIEVAMTSNPITLCEMH